MTRFMLVPGLLLLSAGAFAAEPAPAESETAGCPRPEAQAGESPETAATTSKPAPPPASTAPVRPRSSGSAGRSTPRWNTLLPGMIR